MFVKVGGGPDGSGGLQAILQGSAGAAARGRDERARGGWRTGRVGAAALLADALSRPDVTRVYAHALLSNPGSIRVMQKIGMTYAAPWSYRGVPGAEYEARPGTGPLSAPAKRP